jgi:DNA-binding NarL/FixJ family response regulator
MNPPNDKGLIVGLATDLFFAPKIETAAGSLGNTVKWVAEYQPTAVFVQLLHEEKPGLIILDLNSSLPWVEWLTAAKGEAGTRHIPWLAFGSHMNPRRLKAARHSGADKVVPKSEFSADLAGLITGLLKK